MDGSTETNNSGYTTTNKLANELNRATGCTKVYLFFDKGSVRKTSIDSYYVTPLVYADKVKTETTQLLNLKDAWVETIERDEWKYWVLVIDASTTKQFTKDNITHDYHEVKLMRCKSESLITEMQSTTVINDFTDFI